jgi:hypothetical protein
MKKLIALLSITAVTAANTLSAAVISQWTFENSGNSPTTGSGSALLIGGTTGSFGEGHLGGTGWLTSNYPGQSFGSGTAGVQFNVSTVGFDFIEVSYDHLASATASRWSEFQYTLNRSVANPVWVTYASNDGDLSPQDTFTTQTFDLSNVSGVENNANFAFRIVSVFSPLAFNPGVPVQEYGAFTAYQRAHPNSLNGGAYAASGAWEFDNVTVGTLSVVVPEPSTVWLCTAGTGIALLLGRRLHGPVS